MFVLEEICSSFWEGLNPELSPPQGRERIGGYGALRHRLFRLGVSLKSPFEVDGGVRGQS